MPTGLINMDRGEFLNNGILPRQRKYISQVSQVQI